MSCTNAHCISPQLNETTFSKVCCLCVPYITNTEPCLPKLQLAKFWDFFETHCISVIDGCGSHSYSCLIVFRWLYLQLAREVASMTRLLETREREIDSLREIIEFVSYFSFITDNTICIYRCIMIILCLYILCNVHVTNKRTCIICDVSDLLYCTVLYYIAVCRPMLC